MSLAEPTSGETEKLDVSAQPGPKAPFASAQPDCFTYTAIQINKAKKIMHLENLVKTYASNQTHSHCLGRSVS